MIARIVLTPAAEGGMAAMLEGDLARILAICAGAESKNARRVRGGRSAGVLSSQVSVVAGARNMFSFLVIASAVISKAEILRATPDLNEPNTFHVASHIDP
jgi:hypothetical protein